MAIGCQEVSARMMELLYGELSGEDRAAVEAHLAGCASCRAELAAFQATRVAARRALDEDAPPARAHQAILRAAAAAVAAKQPQPIEARPLPARPSFWERLRTRWTLPTFATIGAVAVVVLASKVFLEPDKTVELGRQALRPTPTAAPAAPPAEGAPQPEAQEAAKEAAKSEMNSRLDRVEPPAVDKAAARSVAAPTAQHRLRAAPADGFGTLDGLTKGGGSGRPAPAKAPALDDLAEGEAPPPAPPATPAPKPARREFAPPPPPRNAPAGASATGSDQAKDRDLEENALEGAAPPGAGKGRVGGGAGAPPPAAHAAKAKKSEKADSPAEPVELDRGPAASASAPAPSAPAAPAAQADEESRADKKTEAKAAGKSGGESPVARADRLFAEGRWAEAARAYRELLRHDPHNADAARWRQRQAASEAAAAPEAPAAAPPPAR